MYTWQLLAALACDIYTLTIRLSSLQPQQLHTSSEEGLDSCNKNCGMCACHPERAGNNNASATLHKISAYKPSVGTAGCSMCIHWSVVVKATCTSVVAAAEPIFCPLPLSRSNGSAGMVGPEGLQGHVLRRN